MARRGSAASASSGRWTTSSRGRRTPAPAPTLSPWASARSAPAAPCGRRAALARGLPGDGCLDQRYHDHNPEVQLQDGLSPGREGAHALWSEARRAWCCENHGLGCPTKTQYDCSEDYFDWERLWSEEKKAWCCMAKGRGCPASTTSTRPPRRKSAEQPSSGDELFNCTAGYAQREQGWSESKLEWCCRHKTIGCSVWSSAGRKFGMVAVEAATSPGAPAVVARLPPLVPRPAPVCWAAPRCWRAASLRWAHGRRAAAVPGRDGGRPRSTPRSGR
ncbi:unnamed protein product [Prorocentrum cordatum]|uniref:Cellulase n=1 Tax=Prorocentrum cordatum TaxID=2364126 RepID=A0ABN9V7U7_9DINO|nr:unnamed protein product [Polarella glacialis]